MSTYKLGLYEKALPKDLDWTSKMIAARDAGYDYLELSIDETDEKLHRLEWSMEERWELNRLMHEQKMPLRSICLSAHRKYPLGSHHEPIRKRGMEIMAKALQLADDLGIRIIQLAGYDVFYEDSSPQSRAMFADNLKQVALMAAQYGILLGFETMETSLMNTVEKAMNYVRLIGSPYIQIYPDIGNITNAAAAAGKDVLDDLATGSGHFVAMHLKETKPGHFREVPFGEGHVDFDKAIRKAMQMGIRRYVVECWDTGSSQWLETILKNYRIMRERLDQEQARLTLAADSIEG